MGMIKGRLVAGWRITYRTNGTFRVTSVVRPGVKKTFVRSRDAREWCEANDVSKEDMEVNEVDSKGAVAVRIVRKRKGEQTRLISEVMDGLPPELAALMDDELRQAKRNDAPPADSTGPRRGAARMYR